MFSMQDILNEAREEVRKEVRKKFALSMLKDDFDVQTIIKYTELLEKEVQALAKKHGLKLKRSK